MRILVQLFSRALRLPFPRRISDYSLSIKAMSRMYDGEPVPMMLYFDAAGKYVDYKPGQIVPLEESDGWVAWYKILRWTRPYGDYAGWDDGRNYELELARLTRGLDMGPGVCRWCRCTEKSACRRKCSWIDSERKLCSTCE